jgi:hypothetical protein
MQGTMGKCECSDSGCPAHNGASECNRKASVILYRVDMDDESGTAFCGKCADDALSCGLFKTED